VVDRRGRLEGVIMVDDVVDVIDEEAEEDLLKMGGVGIDDMHASPVRTARLRAVWLTVNLATAVLASFVIGQFEGAIEKIVALAVLMPIVASMGGNAGTQTVTVAVRALAMGELTAANAFRFVAKEAAVGGLNGLIFAFIMGAAVVAWYGDWRLGTVIAAAMICNLVAAALAGTLIPLGLQKFGVDPAVSSTVFLTTVTDVIGFLAFLDWRRKFLFSSNPGPSVDDRSAAKSNRLSRTAAPRPGMSRRVSRKAATSSPSRSSRHPSITRRSSDLADFRGSHARSQQGTRHQADAESRQHRRGAALLVGRAQHGARSHAAATSRVVRRSPQAARATNGVSARS
jgi:cation transporter-like permease